MNEDNARTNLNHAIRQCLAATALALLLMAAWSLIVSAALPPGAQVPIHWNLEGEPDSFASKGLALTVLPATMVAVILPVGLIPVLDPRRRHIAQSAGFLRMAWLSTLMIFVALHIAMGLLYLGWTIPLDRVAFTAVGFLFILLGNLLGKVRSNYFMGVRTPWTLSSEYTWTKTNRATGWVMVAAGVVIVLAGAALGGVAAFSAIMGTVIVMLVVPVAYSYAVWRTAPDRDESQPVP